MKKFDEFLLEYNEQSIVDERKEIESIVMFLDKKLSKFYNVPIYREELSNQRYFWISELGKLN